MCVWSAAQPCLTLCDPMDYSLPGSSVHGIFQARILGWLAISFSRELPDPGVEPTSLESPVMTGEFFTSVLPGKLGIQFSLLERELLTKFHPF